MPPRKPRNPQRELPYGAGDVRERDGRWQARWTDADGTRHARRFDSEDEANDYLRERYRARRDGRSLPPAELTVADVIRDWLDRGRDDWRPTTYADNRRYAVRHVIPEIGHLRIDTLDTARVQQWIDQMRRAGASAHMIGNCVRIVSSAYRQAMQIGLVRHNPASGVKRPTIRKPEIVTWDAGEIAAVDTSLATDPMWHALYRLALTTGMRPGELRALRWEDVDHVRGAVRVRRTMTRDEEDRAIVGSSTKTGRERTVTLAPSAAHALKRWRREQAAMQLAAPRWDPGGYVFTGQRGQPLGATTWQKRHARLLAATGVAPITLHGLRHTFATVALERNIHPKIVSEMLGHTTVEMTLNRYSHARIDLQAAAANALDAALFGSSGTQDGTDG